MDSRRKEAAWSQFFHMIREQFPHCKIINLTVEDGAVSSYERIRYTKVPSPSDASQRRGRREGFNAKWRWLAAECGAIGRGIIPEVHFRDGDPHILCGETPGSTAEARDRIDRVATEEALAVA